MSHQDIPVGYERELSSWGPVLFDGMCGEPVAWGFKILVHLGEARFNALGAHGNLECLSFGKWALVNKYLTRDDAQKNYGPITQEEFGPRGGWKSVTFGTKQFVSKILHPESPLQKGLERLQTTGQTPD